MRTLLAGVITALAFVTVTYAAPAHAEVSAGCRLHLERVEAATGKRVTAAEDRRHWLERGQPAIYCSEEDARQDGSADQASAEEEYTADSQSASNNDQRQDDGKSRYCRKRWFC